MTHPEVQLREAISIYNKMYGVDISGFNLEDVISHIREIELGDIQDLCDVIKLQLFLKES